MDFADMFAAVVADLTPQPWDFTAADGTRLTVVAAGMPHAAPGEAEVLVRVTAGKTLAAEVGIPSADMPGLLAALDKGEAWEHVEFLVGPDLTLAPADDGALIVTVTEYAYADSTPDSLYDTPAAIRIPAAQRMPLASALRRATDVARTWED